MKKHNGKKINAYTGYREIRSCHYCNTPGHLQMNCRQKIMDERIAKDSTDDDDTRQAEAYLASKIADPDPLPIRHEDGTVHWQGEKQASTSTTAPQLSQATVALANELGDVEASERGLDTLGPAWRRRLAARRRSATAGR
jgi:hypothetical protein